MTLKNPGTKLFLFCALAVCLALGAIFVLNSVGDHAALQHAAFATKPIGLAMAGLSAAEFKAVHEAFMDVNKTITEFSESIKKDLKAEREEREALEAKINRMNAFGGGAGGGSKTITSEDAKKEYKALNTFIRSGDDAEMKAMSVGSDPDGGYTVLPFMSAQMTTRIYDQSPMRRLCHAETVTHGDAFEEIDDRGEAEANWVSETGTRSKGATPQIGKIRIPIHEIYALQPITQRLLDDSDRDLGAWIDGKIGDKFGRKEGTGFISGDGVGKPRGLLEYTTTTENDFTREAGKIQHVVSGDANLLFPSGNADVLKTTIWKLRAPYRQGAVWQMNSNTASAMDKIKDNYGDYIWRNGMTAGAPPSLLGYPVEINEDMPDIAANAYPVAFGNFQLAYIIVDKPGIKMLRDPFTDKPNVLFYAYKRVGGGLGNDDAVKLIKISA